MQVNEQEKKGGEANRVTTLAYGVSYAPRMDKKINHAAYISPLQFQTAYAQARPRPNIPKKPLLIRMWRTW